MRKITEAIIHTTATPANWRAGSATSAKVREVKRWHVDDRGWSDIGYHFLIDRDGTVATGRPIERDGAHVQGRNKGTIGIALFGGHGSSENDAFEDNFTPEQNRALRKLIADLQDQYGFTSVSGHNQWAAKACPGFNVPKWMNREPARTSKAQSTTLQASAGQIVGGVGTAAGGVAMLDGTAQIVALAIGGAIILLALYIMRERLRKWAAGDR